MPFFMTDDAFPTSRKVKKLTAPILAGDLLGLAALGMWDLAGASSQAALSDGALTLADLIGLVYDRAVAEQLAHLLVDAGLWHGAGHDCPRCEPVAVGSWRFHDWWDMRYKSGAELREARAKAREAKDAALVNAVWYRDCIDPTNARDKFRAVCRYCDVVVNRKDTSSKDLDKRPNLDHVDPSFAGGASNLVVSCAGCNRKKAKRTPAEAGMTLKPAPRVVNELDDADVSPGTPAAETAPARLTLALPVRTEQSRPEEVLEAKPESPPTGVRAGAPVHAPGPGSGTGLGLRPRLPQGDAQPTSDQPTPKRKRRRGRGGKPPTTNAGSSPRLSDPPSGGSPWKGWTGPPSPISDENICPYHELHLPCRKCATSEGDS